MLIRINVLELKIFFNSEDGVDLIPVKKVMVL